MTLGWKVRVVCTVVVRQCVQRVGSTMRAGCLGSELILSLGMLGTCTVCLMTGEDRKCIWRFCLVTSALVRTSGGHVVGLAVRMNRT